MARTTKAKKGAQVPQVDIGAEIFECDIFFTGFHRHTAIFIAAEDAEDFLQSVIRPVQFYQHRAVHKLRKVSRSAQRPL